jgi:uncharacterized protein with HEPN domain
MTQHDDAVRLRDMLEHAREAVVMGQGKTRESIKTDRALELSLTRLVEVVGEAAARVSRSGQDRYPDIPWAEIIGLRNRLVHGYASVDLDILWDIIEFDLAPLIASLERIVGEG